MSIGECSYKKENVEDCMEILLNHIDEINKTASKEEGMGLIEKTVISLNKINEECDYEIIETDQREDICEIICMTAYAKGYINQNEDPTEEWREW